MGSCRSTSWCNAIHFFVDAERGDSFTVVKTVVGSSGVQATKIIVPTNQSFFNKWVRIKLKGLDL